MKEPNVYFQKLCNFLKMWKLPFFYLFYPFCISYCSKQEVEKNFFQTFLKYAFTFFSNFINVGVYRRFIGIKPTIHDKDGIWSLTQRSEQLLLLTAISMDIWKSLYCHILDMLKKQLIKKDFFQSRQIKKCYENMKIDFYFQKSSNMRIGIIINNRLLCRHSCFGSVRNYKDQMISNIHPYFRRTYYIFQIKQRVKTALLRSYTLK